MTAITKLVCVVAFTLLSAIGLLACRQSAPTTTTVAPIPEPTKKLEPKERLVGHWRNEDHRPDGTKAFINDYFFRPDSYTVTFRIEPNGRVFRLDWPYRVMHSDEQSIIIQIASDGPQSEYTFLDPDTMKEKSYDEKKRAWHEEPVIHRVDDKTSP